MPRETAPLGTTLVEDANDEPSEDPSCDICDEEVSVDGDDAIERYGNTLCKDCVDEPVAFRYECTSQFCDFGDVVEGTEFDRGAIKTRAHQEANSHEKRKRVFENNPMHTVTVKEVA